MTDADRNDDVAETGAETEKKQEPKLGLQVKIDSRSACERHITVEIPRPDIDRFFEMEFDELAPQAQVPGFRTGHAPRRLLVNRFREQIADQVKGKLIVAALEQVNEQNQLFPISEPDLKLDSVVLPDEGPMMFEFDIEVRPEFSMPEWKGLDLKRPIHEITDDEVRQYTDRLLAKHAKLQEIHEPAKLGDRITLNMTFTHEGNVLSTVEAETVPVKPKLSFQDATVDDFGGLMVGAKRGEKRQTKVTISPEAQDLTLAGKEVTVDFEVLRVEKLLLPHLTSAFLDEIGGFKDEADLKNAVREELERQQKYRQQQQLREQITTALTVNTKLDLPPAMLRRQSDRELKRVVIELQSAGFNRETIQAHANLLRQNALAHTARALKEHFILERLAEDNKFDAEPADYDHEIELIAEQSGLPPRRVRARLEKHGEMDALRNQIIERKVVDLITAHASVVDVPYEPPVDDTVAIDHMVGGLKAAHEIPEALHSDEAKPVPHTAAPRG